MRDVSVVVGGFANAGQFSTPLSTQGDIDTQSATTVLVENYSCYPFQIGREYIAPLCKRTFAIDNYPSLHWVIGASLAQINVGPLRLVRIILDPFPVGDDGPVYPNPLAIGSNLVVPPTNGMSAGAIDMLAANSAVDLTQVRDIGYAAILLQGTGLDTYLTSVTADNTPAHTISALTLPHTIYAQTPDFIGKDWSYYTVLGGEQRITYNMNANATKGSIITTFWIGYHL